MVIPAVVTTSVVLLTVIPAAVEVRPIGSGAFEASGATGLPSGQGILFVDDGRPSEVFWLRLRGGRSPSVVPVTLEKSVPDPEGITNDGSWVYVVGSQSRGGKAGVDLARFHFDAATGSATSVEVLGGLPDLLRKAVPELGSLHGKKREGLNIEGLAWDAGRHRLLLGLRSPLAGGDALVIPIGVAKGPLAASAISVDPAIRVPLGGDGIRSIEQVAGGGFLIVAGDSTGAGHFRLFSWSGKGAPKPVTDLPDALKPEGVARIDADGHSVTVLLGDSGQYAILD